MHAMSSLKTEDLSAFAQQGISRHRIHSVLKSKVCPCSCSMPEKALLEVCEFFWRLPKIAQDAVLWSIQAECCQRRRQWFLQGPTPSCYPLHFTSFKFRWTKFLWTGHPICKEAWLRFLGVGSDRIARCKRNHQGMDKRTLSCGGGVLSFNLFSFTNFNHVPQPARCQLFLSKDQLLARHASGPLSRVSSCTYIGRRLNAQQHRLLAAMLPPNITIVTCNVFVKMSSNH